MGEFAFSTKFAGKMIPFKMKNAKMGDWQSNHHRGSDQSDSGLFSKFGANVWRLVLDNEDKQALLEVGYRAPGSEDTSSKVRKLLRVCKMHYV